MYVTTTGLERLNCWVKARDYAKVIYREVLPLLPADEKYNLNSQIRRAATSIPANIAEGYGRYYYQSNIQFCYNARGSLEELLSHLVLSRDFGYINNDVYEKVIEQGNNLDLLLNGYITYLRKTKQGEKEFTLQKSIQEDHAIYIEE
ncbi:MAG: four helix bundle protein [Chloroflexi bacterium HGW-Chloroflexi-4]|nr:MAG: four helix bundle protein [Chloroflexi bacterium HGW-Chloroflexi-7]PKN97552.1 MAG: four helix bundle protein [Chloroflexi bacterium HGW-Chloroflexi-4]